MGHLGGTNRAKNLTPEERSNVASKAGTVSAYAKRDRAKQTFLKTLLAASTKEERNRLEIEEAKYDTDKAVKNLVRLIGEVEAKEYILSQKYLPF